MARTFSSIKTRRIMAEQGVSVRELARRLEARLDGRPFEQLRTQLHGWFSGRVNPTDRYVEAIALALEVAVADVTDEAPDDDELLEAVAARNDEAARRRVA